MAGIDENIADIEDFCRIRETQIENVLRLIDKAIGRLTISLILPKLADDIETVRTTLEGTLYEPAIKMLETVKTLKRIQKQIINYDVLKIIDYFQGHYEMFKKFPQFVNKLSKDDRKILVACNKIQDVATRHLWRTSKSVISMERQMHSMYKENVALKETIDVKKKKLKSKFAVLRWRQAVKFLILEKHENDLATKKRLNAQFIQDEIQKRHRMERKNRKQTVQYQRELEEQLEKTRTDYERLLQKNALEEKNFRAEKSKLLIQLGGLLQKFDTTIADKMRLNLDMEDQLKQATKELSDFMVIYRKEEAVYKKIVVKYEEEEQYKKQQRILLYMMNRAARKIQTYWLKWRKIQEKKQRRLEKLAEKKAKKK